jgi:Family of unknown function (DUF6166)
VSRYEGSRTKAGPIVTIDGELLDLRLDLHNHSPTGFDWGYCGSGPAQLALAMLAHHLQDDTQALNLYQRFKWSVIAELPHRRWTLTSEQIQSALQPLQSA